MNRYPDHDSDKALLADLRALRPEAFEQLLERYEAPVYRFFYCSHGNHDQAQDQCGETFAVLLTALGRFRGEAGALRAFIFGVARNVLRRGWREKELLLVPEDVIGGLPDPSPSPFENASRRQQIRRAFELICRLREPDRQIVLLRFVEELKLEEIAVSLEIPLNTVKSILHRSCRELRGQMDAFNSEVAGADHEQA